MCDLDHGYDAGYGQLYAETQVKAARKAHKCGECARDIKKGQPYRIFVGTFEGDFWQTKMCNRCSKAVKWLAGRGHGWVGNSVLSDVRHCVKQDLELAAAGQGGSDGK